MNQYKASCQVCLKIIEKLSEKNEFCPMIDKPIDHPGQSKLSREYLYGYSVDSSN